MSKAKILIFTDPHFEAPAARMARAVATMNWVCDLATQHRVNAIVCTGDVTNRAILTTPEEVAGFNQSMIRMANLADEVVGMPDDFAFHIASGNHDKLSTSRAMATIGILEIHPNVHVHTEFSITKIGDVPVAFLPYGVEMGERRNAKILFSHVDFTGVPYNFTGYEAKKGYTLKDVKGYEKVFNGHIHLPSVQGNLVNTGSVLPQKMDYIPLDHPEFEKLLPKVILLEVGDDNTMTMTEFKNPHATLYLTLNLQIFGTFDGYLNKLKALSEQHLVHCRVVCDNADDAKATIQIVQPFKSDRLSFRVMERVNAKQTMTVQESTAQKVKSIDDSAILDRLRGHVTTAFPELRGAFEDVVQRVLGVHHAESPHEPVNVITSAPHEVINPMDHALDCELVLVNGACSCQPGDPPSCQVCDTTIANEKASCSGCGFDPKTDDLPGSEPLLCGSCDAPVASETSECSVCLYQPVTKTHSGQVIQVGMPTANGAVYSVEALKAAIDNAPPSIFPEPPIDYVGPLRHGPSLKELNATFSPDVAEIMSPVDPLQGASEVIQRVIDDRMSDEEAAQYLVLPPGATWEDIPEHSDDCGQMLIGLCDCWGSWTYWQLARARKFGGHPAGQPWDQFVRVED